MRQVVSRCVKWCQGFSSFFKLCQVLLSFMSFVICNMSDIIFRCHLSYVIYHMSFVKCRVSDVASGCVKLFQYVSSDAKVFQVVSRFFKLCQGFSSLSDVSLIILYLVCHCESHELLTISKSKISTYVKTLNYAKIMFVCMGGWLAKSNQPV